MPSSQRVAVVTGANKGIGFGIVKELCLKFNGRVYLTSRDESKGRAAVAELKQLGLHPLYHQLDIDDESSILRLRDSLLKQHGGLDVLVNNAGINIFPEAPHTFYQRAVKIVGTNFFSTIKVCEILFPILRAHARVVNVSSSVGHLTILPPESEQKDKFASTHLSYRELHNLMEDYIEAAKKGNHARKGWPDTHFSAYSVSKVGLCALTRIQQRHFDQGDYHREDIIVNSVHPGYVVTDMTKHTGVLTIEQGAQAPTWLALLPPNIEGPKGSFVWSDKQIFDWVNGPIPPFY